MNPWDEERPGAAHPEPSEQIGRHQRHHREPEGTALRRRRACARRLAILPDGRADPLDPTPLGDVSPAELVAWRAAWSHLRAHGYAVDVPAQVVAAGERERFRTVAS